MRGRSYDTAYCSDPTCPGWDGVDRLYTGDTMVDEGEYIPNECPHCDHRLTGERELDAETAVATLLEVLDGADLLPSRLNVDELDVVRAVIKELRRQAKQARDLGFARNLNNCPRCGGRGEIVARTTSIGGGCVNDDWDVCPDCHGTGRLVLRRTA